jgi:hypothetical protein
VRGAADSTVEASAMLSERVSQPPGSHSRWPLFAVLAALAVPFIIGVFALCGRAYTPVGDEASILFRIREVGTSHTPLVGVYSTRQWAHPGPILYYLLAGPFRLLGGHPNDMFVGAIALNLVSVLLCVYLLYRRRKGLTFLVSAALVGVLLWGLTAGVLVDVWNPDLPLLLYLAFLLSLWALAERDTHILPVMAALAAVVIQLHVAYVPLVLGGIGTIVAVILIALRPSWVEVGAFLRSRPALLAAGVTVLIWLPAVIDQLFGSGNLHRLGSYFKGSENDNVGLSYGFGLISDHIVPHGPWSGGHERTHYLNVQPGSLTPLLLVLLALGALSLVLIRRRRNPGLPLVAIGQLLLGGVAASKLEPPLLSYLMIWMLPLAAFCWIAIVVAVIDCLDGLPSTALVRRTGLGLAAVAVLAGGLDVVRVSASMTHPPLPRQEYAGAVTDILRQIPMQPQESIRIEGVGDDFGETSAGILYGLSLKTSHFYSSDGAVGQKWGNQHRWKHQKVSASYTIAITEPLNYGDPVRRCQADPQQREVASWDQLTAAQRSDWRKDLLLNYRANGHLTKALNDELNELMSRAFRIEVFVGPTTCGGAPA